MQTYFEKVKQYLPASFFVPRQPTDPQMISPEDKQAFSVNGERKEITTPGKERP